MRSLQRLSQMEGEAPQQVNVTDLEEDLKVGRKGVGGGGERLKQRQGRDMGRCRGRDRGRDRDISSQGRYPLNFPL